MTFTSHNSMIMIVKPIAQSQAPFNNSIIKILSLFNRSQKLSSLRSGDVMG